MTDTYLNIEQAAQYLHTKPSTLTTLCRRKKMPFFKGIGMGYLFTQPMLDKWMETRHRKAAGERAQRTKSVR